MLVHTFQRAVRQGCQTNDDLRGHFLKLWSISGIHLNDAGYSSFSKSDLDTAAMEAGAPEGFFCPISLKLFRDPVMLPTGQTCAPLTPSCGSPCSACLTSSAALDLCRCVEILHASR